MPPHARWIDGFVRDLARVPSTPRFTNFYGRRTAGDAARRHNLHLYLREMARRDPALLLVGEAPGHRGTKLTGVPFADRRLLLDGAPALGMLGASRGYRLPPDVTSPIVEQTSTVMWRTLTDHSVCPLLWAAFPFHPHGGRGECSNRAPLAAELATGREFLLKLVDTWNIPQVVAVGHVAQRTLRSIGLDAQRVRHPARGGQREFAAGLGALVIAEPPVRGLQAARSDGCELGSLRAAGVPG